VSGSQEITYVLDFRAIKRSEQESPAIFHPSPADGADSPIPRIARLLALAIRFDRLLRAGEFRDYAELARLGRVTRARITQIMRLLDLAPDIQEQILFLPKLKGLNERNLRPIVRRIDWNEQRRMFRCRAAPSGMVQKYSHDGSKLLQQIGKKGVLDSSDGTEKGTPLNSNAARFHMPSGLYVDPGNGDIYISDGEGRNSNKRVR
jgi:hypothetical protein